MSKRTIVVEYDEGSVFERALKAVQEKLGHHDNPMQALVDGMTLYAIKEGLPPFKKTKG
jgi:hypothetical protein